MNKTLRTILLIVLAVVIVGAGAYALYTKKALSPTEPMRGEQGTAAKRYTNFAHDFRFTYPEGYVLTEQEVGTDERGHYQIMLVRAEDATPPENGEGPTAVTIDVYQNNLDTLSVMDWMNNVSASNYKLGNGTSVKASVGEQDATSYTWSGLYEGRTTVLAYKDDLIAISVTWMAPEDEIIDTYEHVLDSFEFGEYAPQ